ncbi:MAG: hypothetical protein ACR2PF_08210 [Rhizobiaceae bacterium]
MTSSPLLVHIGYHKTATTWLQLSLFCPEHGFAQVMTHDEIFAHVVTPHELDFDADAARALLKNRRGQGAAGQADVVSLEALVGQPFHGGRESEIYARRLKEITADARILITIREQCRMIASVYMQYLRRGGTLSPQAFFEGEAEGGFFGFDTAHFEYDRLVRLYQSIFGPENVLVLPQERIARDQPAAVAEIAGLAGNTVIGAWKTTARRGGIGAPEGVAWALRRINHLQSGPAHRQPIIDLGAATRLAYRATERAGKTLGLQGRPITELARRRFGDQFTASNRRLAGLIGDSPDLSGYQGLADG